MLAMTERQRNLMEKYRAARALVALIAAGGAAVGAGTVGVHFEVVWGGVWKPKVGCLCW